MPSPRAGGGPNESDGWNRVVNSQASGASKNMNTNDRSRFNAKRGRGRSWREPLTPGPRSWRNAATRAGWRSQEKAVDTSAETAGWEANPIDGWNDPSTARTWGDAGGSSSQAYLYPADPEESKNTGDADKHKTMEEVLANQGHLHEQLVRDLVPFWLKTVEAAERGEPEVKLEAYFDELIREKKASGWYWTPSDKGRKDGDGWSDHKEGWGEAEDLGWGEPDTGARWGDPRPPEGT